MTALIIDGKQIAQKLRADWKLRADRLNALGIAPGLAVVMVGDNPASQVYVRNKIKACREVGIRSDGHSLGGDSSQETVLSLIDRLNADAGIHGNAKNHRAESARQGSGGARPQQYRREAGSAAAAAESAR